MGVKYSYDDFTTKGHGVIEGYWPGGKKKKRKKRSKKKKPPTLESSNKESSAKPNNAKRQTRQELYNEAYSNLMKAHKNAKRRIDV